MTGRVLTRDEIVGSSITEIWQHDEGSSPGLDIVTTFYRLESGPAFFLPAEWSDEIVSEPLPPSAIRLQHPSLIGVIEKRIIEVYRALPDSNWPFETAFLHLENGFLVYDMMGAHSGTGGTGVFIVNPRDWKRSEFRALWNTPSSPE